MSTPSATGRPPPPAAPPHTGLPVELLAAILGSSPVAAAVFDLDGRLIDANAALQALLGHGLEALLGRTGVDLLEGDVGRQCAAGITEVATTGRTHTTTLVSAARLAPSGSPFALETTYYRLEGASGPLGVVALMSDVTQEHATEGALRLANERLLLVGQVTSLLGEFLDVDRTIERLCDLVVPTFADHCLVDLVTDQAAFQRRINRDARGLRLPGEAGWTPAGSIVTYPADSPMLVAVRSGQSQLVEIDPATFDYTTMAPNGRSGDHLRSMGVASVLIAPLWARGSVVGLIILGTSGSGRRFGPDAMAMATQLADRAAVAIDNAMLYEKQQQFALTLQRSLLPPSLPKSLGLSAAARYLPAKDGGAVGGDWYDVIPLSVGRIAIVVGDVMGRGVAAAALMGQVRAALRAYAVQDLAPAHVLECADELVRGLDDDAIVTCVYGVFDPRDEQLTFGNAGHVPPLLVRADGGDVVRIDATGPPLGAGGLLTDLRRDAMDPLGLEPPGEEVGRRRRSDASTPYTQVTVKIPPDALLAAYTDGLVESRDQDAESGIERLLHVLQVVVGGRMFRAEANGARSGDLDLLCDEVLRLMARTSAADDVALLLIRPDPTTRPDVAAVSLDPLPEEVARARAFTHNTLESWGESEALEDVATLVVSELVTNAVRHASSPARLKLSRHDDSLIVEVRDSAAAPPRWRRAALDDEGGRGLMLVSLLSAEWGARILPEGGKAVWCRLEAPRAVKPTTLA